MPDTYVALDLETTGLDPHACEIIEVGAVKFRGPEVLDTFQTFVRPRQALPKEIEELTGITPRDLRDAPSFPAVAGDLQRFIGAYPLVIQNAAFDLEFLAGHGLHLSNRVLDTLDLARVLLGTLPERSLPALATHFGIEALTHHRALPDAHTAREVFLALRQRALSLDPRTVGSVAGLGGASEWALRSFFQEILTEKITAGLAEAPDLPARGRLGPSLGAQAPARAEQTAAPANGHTGLSASPPLRGRNREGGTAQGAAALDGDALATLLGPGGPIARTFPGFEHREEQVSMLRAVARALNEKQHLVVEAGTGTGKSMAYLLPALVHAVRNGATVVVATNTIALQDQIVSKDLPSLLHALGAAPGGPARGQAPPAPAKVGQAAAPARDERDLPDLKRARFAVLKGRGNYLCPRRWSLALGGNAPGLDPSLIARIAVWQGETATGDRAELNLNGGEAAAWRRLSAETDNCPGGQCAQVRASECFLQRARQRAAEAHVVVINHALLIADLVAGGSILPEYDYLIIDEAHHLEDVATDQLGFRISHGNVSDLLDRLEYETGGRPQGLLAQIESSIRTAPVLFVNTPVLLQHIGSLRARVPGARARAVQLFGHLSSFLQEASDPSDYGRRVRLTPAVRHHHLWERVEQAWEDLRLTVQDLREGLEHLATAMRPLAEFQPEGYEATLAEMEVLHAAYASLTLHGNAAIASPDQEWVSWVSAAPDRPAAGADGAAAGDASATVYAAPIEVGPMLARDLFQKRASVVLTSATLRTAEGFGYFESRVGLERPLELALDSSFPYQQTALLLLPQDLAHPTHPAHYRAMEQSLIDLCAASGGRALVLFTSYSALQSAYRALRPALDAAGIRVLAQGGGAGVQRMLDQLRSRPNTVLLGTSSFWEGVDVAGEALSLLVITRLPFTVPTEPVFQARSERFEDPFGEYALPQAVLRFRQGFGRLIRSRTDRGVCAVLDPRVATMRYGRSFLDALPPATVKRCNLREAPGLVASWLGAARPLL